MKASTLLSVPLVMVLLTGAKLAGEEVPPPMAVHSNYKVHIYLEECQTAQCFDEVLWNALEKVADIEADLPSHLQAIEVVVQPANLLTEPLRITFYRADFRALMAGSITPAMFLRVRAYFA